MQKLLRKFFIIVALLLIWEVAAYFAHSPLLLPSFSATVNAIFEALQSRDANLLSYILETCRSLFSGFIIGSFIATILTILAVNTKIGEEFLSIITSALAPLPAVAIFPLALMWFGISYSSVVFIAAFATVFPVAVSMTQGFRTVPDTVKNVGKNLGMGQLGLTCRILIPAALPAILSGMRNGFSNAFRALVAVEMVIGAASGSGGLGWYVLSSKQTLDIPQVYAGIVAIMLVGLAFESLFRFIESKTVRRWGMLR